MVERRVLSAEGVELRKIDVQLDHPAYCVLDLGLLCRVEVRANDVDIQRRTDHAYTQQYNLAVRQLLNPLKHTLLFNPAERQELGPTMSLNHRVEPIRSGQRNPDQHEHP